MSGQVKNNNRVKYPNTVNDISLTEDSGACGISVTYASLRLEHSRHILGSSFTISQNAERDSTYHFHNLILKLEYPRHTLDSPLLVIS